MRRLAKAAAILCAALALLGCRTVEKCAASASASVDSVVVERCVIDTLIVIEQDSATLRSLWECDSLGNVLMTQLATANGERTSIEPSVRYIWVKDKDGGIHRTAYFDVLARSDSLTRLVQSQSTRISMLTKSNEKARQEVSRANNCNSLLIAMFIICAAVMAVRRYLKR